MTEVASAYGPGAGTTVTQQTTHTSPSTTPRPPVTSPSTTATASTTATSGTSGTADTGEDDPTETTSGGGGGGGGGGPSVTNITNITNNYYFDVGLQFKPKVGIVTPINTFEDIIFGGSLDKYVYDGSDPDSAKEGAYLPKGTVWTPELSELPDFTSALGRYFKYGVLYNGYWNNSLESPSDRATLSIYKVSPKNNYTDGIHDGETPGAGAAVKDGTTDKKGNDTFVYTVEPSWDNRDPNLVITDDHQYVSFYTPDEMALYNIAPFNYADLQGFVDKQSQAYVMPWTSITNGYILARANPSGKRGDYLYSDVAGIPSEYNKPAVSNYIGTMWYKDTEVAKTTQTSTGPSGAIYIPDEYKTDEFLRALEILGPDILYRDEWVCRVVVDEFRSDTTSQETKTAAKSANTDRSGIQSETGGTNKTGGASTGEYVGLYNYIYNAISVLDDDMLAGKDLLTKDYVIQSLYRAVGVNCLKTSTFLYKDVNANVDFTPLAEKITVNMDRINQIQNHMQVFVTKASLDDYWQRALDDGIVTGSSRKTYNTLDAVYKPFYSIAANNKLPNPNPGGGQWVYSNDSKVTYKGIGEKKSTDKVCVETEWDSAALKQYDAERFTHITLADFCVLAKRIMDIYGEEKLTDKEIELLLVTYGSKLPYDLEVEELEAIKYLMAKGIVTDQMYWSGELKVEDMIVILSRIADEGSRLTFKEVTITYDPSLVSAGYYPTSLNISTAENSPVQVESVSFTSGKSYLDSEWTDFFVRLGDVTYKDSSGKKVTTSIRFSRTNENGDILNYTDDIFMLSGTNPGTVSARSKPDQFRVVEILNGHDGYEYMHFQVASSILFDPTSEDYKKFVVTEEVKDKNTGKKLYDETYIRINTSDSNDKPEYWKVSPTGGIYTNPTAQRAGTDGYVVTFSDGGYQRKVTISGSHSAVTVSPGDKVRPDDYAKLYELHISTTDPVKVNDDGYVISGVHNGITKYASVKGYKSFDEAGMSIEYCDWQRYKAGAATLYSQNPYLADETDTEGKSIESMAVPTYDIIFSISLDEINSSDIVWGDADTVIIKQGKPTAVIQPEGTVIRYLYETATRATYVVEGAGSIADIATYIHCSKDGALSDVNADYDIGYMKSNDTLLVPSDTLLMLMREAFKVKSQEGISIIAIDKNILMLTYDPYMSDPYRNPYMSPYTIILNREIGMVAINSVIYKVPSNEVVFTENTLGSGGEYLINYRAVLGYNSGYKVASVSTDGDVSITVTSDESFSSATIVDLWTRNVYNAHVTSLGKTGALSLNGPNNLANYVVYVSDTAGTYLFNLKNTDRYCSNGYLTTEAHRTAATGTYSLGAEYLDLFFGLSVGADGSADTDILVAGTLLTEEAGTLVISKLSTVNTDDAIGKIVYDTESRSYYYVLPILQDSEFEAALPRSFHRLTTVDAVSYTSMNKLSALIAEKYYSNEWPLPYVTIYSSLSSSYFTFATNTFENLPYGTTPVFAVNPADDLVQLLNSDGTEAGRETHAAYASEYYGIEGEDVHLAMTLGGYPYSEIAGNTFSISNVKLAPTGLPCIIMGIPPMEIGELIKANTAINTVATYGSWVSNVIWTDSSAKLTIFPGTSDTVSSMLTSKLDRARLINGSLTTQWVAINSFGWSYSDQRGVVIENATKPDLDDAEQPLYVDWGKYTFNNLIHDIDNGLSIVLIVVLNFLPRLGMFVFLLLITLGTVANVGWWKRFCTNIFDPYKFLTFGHADVNTIDSRRLLLTSIIGLAVFALFMDGTLINLLTWLCQWVMELIARK